MKKKLIYIISIGLLVLLAVYFRPISWVSSSTPQNDATVIWCKSELGEAENVSYNLNGEATTELHNILEKYHYRRTLTTIFEAGAMSGDAVHIWYDDKVISVSLRGNEESIIDGHEYKIGYIGNEKANELAAELKAFLEELSNRENVNSAANTNFVALEELYDAYTLEQAIEDGCVVHQDADITHGQEIWEIFVQKVDAGEAAKVRLAFYYTLDAPSHYSTEYYESIKDEYPKLFIQDLSFDGSTYTLRWLEEGNELVRNYQYLMRYEGEPENKTATYDSYIKYVLTNDETVTWEDIYHGILSADFRDYIDHYQVYNDYERE